MDALHDHLGTLYPGMRAPSFRCTEKDGSLLLHYYSERPGLEHIVIGIVKVSKCNVNRVLWKVWQNMYETIINHLLMYHTENIWKDQQFISINMQLDGQD